jgi:hypothetical protein
MLNARNEEKSARNDVVLFLFSGTFHDVTGNRFNTQ